METPAPPPPAHFNWGEPDWIYLSGVLLVVIFLMVRRIVLYLVEYSLRGRRTSGIRSSLLVPSASWHNIVFCYEAFQTKYLNRPAICRLAGVNIFGGLDWAEVIITFILYLTNLFLLLLPIRYHYDPMDVPTGSRRERVALRATRCLVLQLPILFATTGRCSLLSFLVGVSYRSLNFVHRAVGRLCFMLAIIHVTSAIFTLALLVGPHTMETIRTTPSFQFAMAAFCCVVISATLSTMWVRQRHFNLFLTTHVFAAAIVLPMIYHHKPMVKPWLIASAVIWSLDRLNRWVGIFLNHIVASCMVSDRIGTITATVDRLDGALVLRIPMHFTWSPGQHIYISFWSWKMMSRPWLYGRWHPFTLTNLSSNGVLRRKDGTEVEHNERRAWTGCCLVQVRGGTTKWLETHAGSNIEVLIDGPYGGNGASIVAYSTLVLIAGGAGITYVIGVLEGVAISARRNQSGHLRRVEVHWVLRNKAQLAWVEARIHEIRSILEGFELQIVTYAYITKMPRVSLSNRLRSEMVSRPIPIAVKLGGMGSHEYLKMIRQAPAPPEESAKDISLIMKEKESAFHQLNGRPNLDNLISAARQHSVGRIMVHVCGPRSLSEQVKIAAARQSSPIEAWKGNLSHCIVVHRDLFNTT